MTACHDAATHKDGYVFETYASTMKAVVAGYPASSKLYDVIATNESDDRMPPSPYSSLSAAQIDTIYNWIARGALDEDCGSSCDTISEISFSTQVFPVITANCNRITSYNVCYTKLLRWSNR